MSQEQNNTLRLNQETIDILVANIIPTTKYFESRFDHLQYQIDEIKNFQREMQANIDKRFEQVDQRFDAMREDIDKRFDAMQKDIDKRFDAMQKDIDRRFEQVDQRFEQVDQRFEQVDKRFEQVDQRIATLSEAIQELTLEVKELGKTQEITLREYIIERDRHYDKKFAQNRSYFLGLLALMATILLKMAGILHFT